MASRKADGRLPARATPEGLLVMVRLTPKSGANQVTGVEDGADGAPVLRARVRAAPEKGKANASLVALLAGWLDVPKSACKLVMGGKSRLKQVLIHGEPDALMDRLRNSLAALRSGE